MRAPSIGKAQYQQLCQPSAVAHYLLVEEDEVAEGSVAASGSLGRSWRGRQRLWPS